MESSQQDWKEVTCHAFRGLWRPSCHQHLLNAFLQGIVIYQIFLVLVTKILSHIYTIFCIPLTNKLIFFFNTISYSFFF